MDNLEKLIQEMNDRISIIDGELAILKQRKKEMLAKTSLFDFLECGL